MVRFTIFDYPTSSSPLICATDVGGAYKWNGSAWVQMLDKNSLPSTDANPSTGLFLNGVWGICSAPSDPTRVYLLYGAFQNSSGPQSTYLFVSNDGGATFTRTAGQTGSPPIVCDPNDGSASPSAKFTGPKMAVDPNNKDIVFFGVQPSGSLSTAWATFNGGATLVDLSLAASPNLSTTMPRSVGLLTAPARYGAPVAELVFSKVPIAEHHSV